MTSAATAMPAQTPDAPAESAAPSAAATAALDKPLPPIATVVSLKVRARKLEPPAADPARRTADGFASPRGAPQSSAEVPSAFAVARPRPSTCAVSNNDTWDAVPGAGEEDAFYGTEGDVRTESDDCLSSTVVENDTAASDRSPEKSMPATGTCQKSLAKPSKAPKLPSSLAAGRNDRPQGRRAAADQNGDGMLVRFSEQLVYYDSPWEYDLLPYLNNCEMPDLDEDDSPVALPAGKGDSVYAVYRPDGPGAAYYHDNTLPDGAASVVGSRSRWAKGSLRFWKTPSRGWSVPKRKRGLFDDVPETPPGDELRGVSPASRGDAKGASRSERKVRAAQFFKKGLNFLKSGRTK